MSDNKQNKQNQKSNGADQKRTYKQAMADKKAAILQEADVRRYNFVTANSMMMFMCNMTVLLTLLSAVLNQVGVFHSDKTVMWGLTAFSAIIVLPLNFYTRAKLCETKRMHWLLMMCIIIICAGQTTVLGHNVVLLMVFPVMLSIRYFDYKFTIKVAVIMIAFAIVLTGATATFGVFNLNICNSFIKDTTLVVTDSLRAALEEMVRGTGGITESIQNGTNPLAAWATDIFRKYFMALFFRETLPRLVIFTAIAMAAAFVAKRCDGMLTIQQETSENQTRIEGELNAATEIQNSMLPCIFPAFPEHKHLELFATYIPAKEVGGDFYDYFNVDDDHIAVVMADVSGKGVGAALFMTIAKIVIKNQLTAGLQPKDAVTEANRQLCENNDAGLFVTGWIGVYQISTCQMTFVNAGHNPPIIRRKDGNIDYLCDRNGFVMAGYDATKYTQSTVDLNQDDEIFLYTDGVTEANNTAEDFYGEDRLLKVVEEAYGMDVQEQLKFIANDINTFIGEAEQFDDITMMALKVK